jgi:hypothetical protein
MFRSCGGVECVSQTNLATVARGGNEVLIAQDVKVRAGFGLWVLAEAEGRQREPVAQTGLILSHLCLASPAKIALTVQVWYEVRI